MLVRAAHHADLHALRLLCLGFVCVHGAELRREARRAKDACESKGKCSLRGKGMAAWDHSCSTPADRATNERIVFLARPSGHVIYIRGDLSL